MLINKKFSEMLDKIDDKVLQKKLNKAVEMLKTGNPEDLAKKMKKVDSEELLKEFDEFDETKIKDLNIDLQDLQEKVSDADLQKLSDLIGKNGDEVVRRIKSLLFP